MAPHPGFHFCVPILTKSGLSDASDAAAIGPAYSVEAWPAFGSIFSRNMCRMVGSHVSPIIIKRQEMKWRLDILKGWIVAL